MNEAAGQHGFLERLFRLTEKRTTVRTEMLAGLTTFISVAYILFVNPNILADDGIPFDRLERPDCGYAIAGKP